MKDYFDLWVNNKEEYDDLFFSVINKGKDKPLSRELVPEPYLGDIRSRASAVIININPGGYEKSESYAALEGYLKENSGYYSYAKDFFHDIERKANDKDQSEEWIFPPSYKWWLKRKSWVERILENSNIASKDAKLIAFELCPWHSASWKGWGKKGLEVLRNEIEDNTIKPAVQHIHKSELQFGLAVSKVVRDTLVDLGFESKRGWQSKDFEKSEDFAKWPLNKKGEPTKRIYELLCRPSDEGKGIPETYVLCTWAPAANSAPSSAFKDVEESICQEIDKLIKTK